SRDGTNVGGNQREVARHGTRSDFSPASSQQHANGTGSSGGRTGRLPGRTGTRTKRGPGRSAARGTGEARTRGGRHESNGSRNRKGGACRRARRVAEFGGNRAARPGHSARRTGGN